jgi:hypothetical protein
MLKVHPEFKIYGLGFANTIKSLVTEGFIEDWETSKLHITSEFYDGCDDKGNRLYEADTPKGVQKVTYETLYNYYAKQAYHFLVTVCEKVGDELVMSGFIYI